MRSANLSAVLSNYNHACFLPRALNAILEQSVRPKELIVVDDGSTDESVTVLEDFARRDPIVRVVRNERNRGVCETINRGVSLATGEYLLFAAADDYLLPGMIQKSLALLDQHPAAGMSCGYCSTIDEDTGVVRANPTGWCERPSYLSPTDLAARIGAGCVPSTSALYRRASVTRAGGYLPDLRWHCDWFMNLAIGFREGICHIPETLALITVRPNTYSAQGTKDEQAMREVVTALLRRLSSPAYCDLFPFIRDSCVMEPFLPYLGQIAATAPEVGRQLPGLAVSFLAPLCERAVRNEADLRQTQTQLAATHSELARTWQHLRDAQEDVARLWQQLLNSQQKTAEAQAVIAAMRSGRLWRIRDWAVRCKQALPPWRRHTA